MTDSSNGGNAQEPARDVGDGGPVRAVTDPDGSARRLIQNNEVIRNG